MMRFLRQLAATGAKIGSPFRRLELTFWFVLSPGRQITRPLVDSSCFCAFRRLLIPALSGKSHDELS